VTVSDSVKIKVAEMSESDSIKSGEMWSSFDWENELSPLLTLPPLPPMLPSPYSLPPALLPNPPSSSGNLDDTSGTDSAALTHGDVIVAGAMDGNDAAGAPAGAAVVAGELGAVSTADSASTASAAARAAAIEAASDAESSTASAAGMAGAASDEVAGPVPVSQGPIVLLEFGDVSRWKESPHGRK
jgi:hypothetical protein